MKTLSYYKAAIFFLSFLCFSCSNQEQQASILVEAEHFQEYGGWLIDTQFMDQMGSPYLIAHGIGKPVKDASNSVACNESGRYRVWVRTYDWVGRWRGEEWPERKRATGEAPGRFSVLINGKPVEGTFGTTGENWQWQKGPVVKLKKGSFILALEDLTGFEGRCDAILFTKEKEAVPPNSNPEMRNWRNELLGLSSGPRNAGDYDLVVVGAGVAGISTALQAARLGVKVALVQDRPVVGGNSSSEVCVNISGEVGFEPYPNVGNIVKEIQPEAKNHWHAGPFETDVPEDEKRLNLILAENNIDLFLNHRANGVEMDGLKIRAILADHTKTSESVRFKGSLFVDCTGDGSIGYLANADYAITPNGNMGRSNLWFIHDIGTPTTFPQCPWALNLCGFKTPEPPTKIDGWYWESGYNQHPIEDGEYIRDWNLRAVYGTWDAYKNDRNEYQTYEIKWLSYISGKRESRRLMGDVVLNRTHLEMGVPFEDGCVPLVWWLDTHYPREQYQKGFEGDEFIARCEQPSYETPYWMPYRCLYSRDVPNLFMAGRDISTTRQALGAVRVQRTTGMMGEIVGKAASICIKNDALPRDVYKSYLDDLKALMR